VSADGSVTGPCVSHDSKVFQPYCFIDTVQSRALTQSKIQIEKVLDADASHSCHREETNKSKRFRYGLPLIGDNEPY
jgi:hypothetical protein